MVRSLILGGLLLMAACPRPQPPPPPVPTPEPTIAPTPILPCDRDLTCGCWRCVETEADRRKIGAPSTVCQQKYRVVCPEPTETPIPEEPRPCRLPYGTGSGEGCPRTQSKLLQGVTDAIARVQMLHPDWFTDGGSRVVPGKEDPFRLNTVDELRLGGFCAFFDGEEIALKNSNSFSEQYAIVSSDSRVRRGENSYRATCIPAWKAIPPTP